MIGLRPEDIARMQVESEQHMANCTCPPGTHELTSAKLRAAWAALEAAIPADVQSAALRLRTVLPHDRRTAEGWFAGRDGVELFDWSLLPGDGLIVPQLAAGWIYLAKGAPVAFLDPLVRNPEAPREAADVALDAVVTGLLDIARANGVRVVLAHARQPAVLERARAHGFTAGRGDYTPLRLEL